MTNQTLPRIFALAPEGLEGLGVVAAASRAAALGIVDLCSGLEGDWLEGLERLAHLTSKPFGVRVRAQDAASDGKRSASLQRVPGGVRYGVA